MRLLVEAPTVIKLFWFAIRVAVVAYLGLCILVFLRQSSLIYYPVKRVMLNPSALGLDYENVLLRTSDGAQLAAWLVPASRGRGTLLMCHGNGGNIGDRLDAIEFFHKLGLNVFIFDYRGYGTSSGTPSERGTYRDALAAWNWLLDERRLEPDSIVIHGRSLGGPIAAWLASQTEPCGLIVEASFTSLPAFGQLLYPYLPVRPLCRYRYDTLRYISQAKCPVLVAHSRDDDLVPFAHGQALFEAAASPKFFSELTGSHNDGESVFSTGFKEELENFFSLIFQKSS